MTGPLGKWIAPLSGAVAIALALGWVTLYAFGRSVPAERELERSVVVAAPVVEVWTLLGDLARRPSWHPGVRAIARIEDREGQAVWREVTFDGDRFDWLVVESAAPHRLVLATAAPEQIGMDARWTWELAAEGEGTRVSLREQSRIDNPVWRGAYVLRYGPDATVEGELDALTKAVADGRSR